MVVENNLCDTLCFLSGISELYVRKFGERNFIKIPICESYNKKQGENFLSVHFST